jgi:hypothetical protein
VRSYWELVEGTHWELDKHVENPFGPKILIPPPSPKRKKNLGPYVHVASPHWLQEVFLVTCVLCDFWPRLMAKA